MITGMMSKTGTKIKSNCVYADPPLPYAVDYGSATQNSNLLSLACKNEYVARLRLKQIVISPSIQSSSRAGAVEPKTIHLQLVEKPLSAGSSLSSTENPPPPSCRLV